MTLSALEKACRELREKTMHDMEVVLIGKSGEAESVIGIEDTIFDDPGDERLVYAMLKPSGEPYW